MHGSTKKRVAQDTRRRDLRCGWFFTARSRSCPNETQRRKDSCAPGVERLPTEEHASRAGNSGSSLTLSQYRLPYSSLVGRSQREGRCSNSRGRRGRSAESDGREEHSHHGQPDGRIWSIARRSTASLAATSSRSLYRFYRTLVREDRDAELCEIPGRADRSRQKSRRPRSEDSQNSRALSARKRNHRSVSES